MYTVVVGKEILEDHQNEMENNILAGGSRLVCASAV
jgi:hypothetical protein